VKANRAALDVLPTAFLSVSLSEASAENVEAPPERRAKSAEQVKATVSAFCDETGLHPSRVWPVAGALVYSKYGFVTRFVMKMIAKSEGNATDTSRDYEYTDWEALDRFVSAMAEEVERGGSLGA
jgi:menaquinone-dependent protoporphyrinogen oxidase